MSEQGTEPPHEPESAPDSEPAAAAPQQAAELHSHPLRLAVADNLRRSRLSSLFRWLLVYPHFIWISVWALAALFAAIAQWFYALFTGRPAVRMHRFLTRFTRYYAHVQAYARFAANPYPHFAGDAGDYPVDLQVDPPAPQSRLKTGFRIVLAIPALVLTTVFNQVGGLIAIVAWVIAIFAGRTPKGLRDISAFLLRYEAQTIGYLLLLTDRYPELKSPHPAGPVLVEPPPRAPLEGSYV